MGTSSSGGGAGGSNPLLPTWIPPFPPPNQPEPPVPPDPDNTPPEDGDRPDSIPQPERPIPPHVAEPIPDANRYRQPRRDFNKYVKSGGTNTQALKDSLRGYSRNAAGNTKNLARRMRPSAGRVADFYTAVNTIKSSGLQAALNSFNLTAYANKPLFEILSALSDEIFKDKGNLYDNTQDDSVTRLAYANTVTRICETENISLESLTNEQIELMTAIFIEETIAQRVICDIGNTLTELETDITKLLEIENNTYQIVSGLVRNRIMPEIIASQRGGSTDIEQKIENIYRIAFDTLGGINE